MRKSKLILLFFLLLGVLVLITCSEKNEIPAEQHTQAVFIGSESCKGCHAQAYEDWSHTHHAMAMQEASDAYVKGDFNHSNFEADGVRYRFYKEAGTFKAIVDESVKRDTFEITHTFGWEPLQQYLISFPDGRKQVLRASWDTQNQKWFHQYPGEQIATDDWMHWTRQSQNWNSMCADCHSTGLQKNHDISLNVYHTKSKEISVGCESCHGPASHHQAFYQKNAPDKKDYYGQSNLKTEGMDNCAACHSRRTQLVDSEIFGSFDDDFKLQLLSEPMYHPDGQIKEEDYVYGSFLSSRMHQQGVVCSDCHQPHSNALKFNDNQLCLQCHTENYDSPTHHFHQENTQAAQCVNCHMTGQNYMGNDFRRDHSFRVPRPDQSVIYDTPNACNTCHQNENAQWAADKITSFYGQHRPKHFSDLLLKGSQRYDPEALITLAADTSFPDITRATAISYLQGHAFENWQQAYVPWASDSSALVRNAVQDILFNAPDGTKIYTCGPALSDPVRSVRLSAFRSLSTTDPQLLPLRFKADYESCKTEYESMLRLNADMREGAMLQADYLMSQGNYTAAIDQYNGALAIDSLQPNAYANQALMFSNAGNLAAARERLLILVRLFPELDHGHYLLALAYHEGGKSALAIEQMEEALRLNPIDSYYYNLILLLHANGEFEKGKEKLSEAQRRFPENTRISSLQTLRW